MTTPTGVLLDGMDGEDLDRLASRLRSRLGSRAVDPGRLYTAKEAALELRCPAQRIYDLARSGQLEVRRDGRRILVTRAELDRRLSESDDPRR